MSKTAIAVIGWHHWYPAGVARMIASFRDVDPNREVVGWVNTLPPGAPKSVWFEDWDFVGYCAKPFALRALRDSGVEVGILLDAAFRAIRPIDPLIEHIEEIGYYLCDNGYRMGEWCADAALEPLKLTRDEAMEIPEVSSYAVGLDFRKAAANILIDEWCRLALEPGVFPGHHTQEGRAEGRNKGHVSHDTRVLGHRHDQTALSAIAWKLGMQTRTRRPQFTAYDGSQDDRTVLVNRGM